MYNLGPPEKELRQDSQIRSDKGPQKFFKEMTVLDDISASLCRKGTRKKHHSLCEIFLLMRGHNEVILSLRFQERQPHASLHEQIKPKKSLGISIGH